MALACCLLVPAEASACNALAEVREASSASVKEFAQRQRKTVLTFVGYSGAGYEDPKALLEHASRILDGQDPAKVLVNIGATAEGIGEVYALAKRKGFTTMGIVSTLARDERVPVSPCVDHVFFVKDATWGGRLPQSTRLSPTSTAIVANSTSVVAIGGGDVARDEALAARKAGKRVRFIAADMNHEAARDKARKRGLPEPKDFKGSAHAALAKTP
jgi:hypothetical protein